MVQKYSIFAFGSPTPQKSSISLPKSSSGQFAHPFGRDSRLIELGTTNQESPPNEAAPSSKLTVFQGENLMRSDLIFGALTHVQNRYKLCQLASKATRKLHKPNTRLQDTTNEVLDRFKDTVPMNTESDLGQGDNQLDRRAA
jgi:hypothetical protein